jgi:hypothetical protein
VKALMMGGPLDGEWREFASPMAPIFQVPRMTEAPAWAGDGEPFAVYEVDTYHVEFLALAGIVLLVYAHASLTLDYDTTRQAVTRCLNPEALEARL